MVGTVTQAAPVHSTVSLARPLIVGERPPNIISRLFAVLRTSLWPQRGFDVTVESSVHCPL